MCELESTWRKKKKKEGRMEERKGCFIAEDAFTESPKLVARVAGRTKKTLLLLLLARFEEDVLLKVLPKSR